MTREKIIVGRFGAAYGVRGWIKVKSFTDPISNILDFQQWLIQEKDNWISIQISDAKPHGNTLVVKLPNCDDPETASTYTNREIAIERSQLPSLSANEFYWSDLIGLEVVNKANEHLGIVEKLLETGSNDVLVVKGDRQRLIPYLKNVIIKVDLSAKKILVDWDSEF